MRDFDYESPTTLSAAIELFARDPERTRALAGGTDLIDHVRMGRLTPDLVVDLKKISELNRLESDESGLILGAAVNCARIAADALVQQQFTALADSARIIGGVQIQHRASMGGNLCNSGPAADSTPSFIALRGRCVIAGPQGTREIAAEDFCTGPGKNALKPGELLVEIRFPRPAERTGSHYRRFIPRNEMDIAVVGVGASITLAPDLQTVSAARIAIGAAAPQPVLATAAAEQLLGRPLSEETLRAAAEAARAVVSPIDDMRGTRDYRLHLVGVLVSRVCQAAAARARGETLDYRPGH